MFCASLTEEGGPKERRYYFRVRCITCVLFLLCSLARLSASRSLRRSRPASLGQRLLSLLTRLRVQRFVQVFVRYAIDAYCTYACCACVRVQPKQADYHVLPRWSVFALSSFALPLQRCFFELIRRLDLLLLDLFRSPAIVMRLMMMILQLAGWLSFLLTR